MSVYKPVDTLAALSSFLKTEYEYWKSILDFYCLIDSNGGDPFQVEIYKSHQEDGIGFLRERLTIRMHRLLEML
jgi:hypothetical protein